MYKLFGLSVIFAIGCVVMSTPYETEFNTEKLNPRWASSREFTTKVMVVHNPTDRDVVIKVSCYEDVDLCEGDSDCFFFLKPHTDQRVHATVPVKYQVGNACEVVQVEYATPQELPFM